MKTPIKIKGYVYRIMFSGEIVFVTSPNLDSTVGYIKLGELEVDAEFDIPEVDEKAQLKADLETRIMKAKTAHETQLNLLEAERKKLDET